MLKKKYRSTVLLNVSSRPPTDPILDSPDIFPSVSPLREPPPYRHPPPAPLSPSSSYIEASPVNVECAVQSLSINENESQVATSASSPPVPPRRKTMDKFKIENKENVDKNKDYPDDILEVSWNLP